MTGPSAARDRIVDYLRQQLIGPGAIDETLRDAPSYRYTMAVLYPREIGAEVVTDEEDLDESGGGVGEELTDDPITLANQYLPSSMGLSFFVEGADPTLSCEVWGAAYEALGARKDGWRRGPSSVDEGTPEPLGLSASNTSADVLSGRATVVSNWRSVQRGFLVTVTLVNTAQTETRHLSDSDGCLFQVGFRCSAVGGRITEYPSVGWLSLGEEDEELLRVLYRRTRAYAVGHGCAARWEGESEGGEVQWVRTEFMPTVDVPPLVQRAGAGDVLSLARLGDLTSDPPISELRSFVADYEAWIDALPTHHEDIPRELHEARDRVLSLDPPIDVGDSG